MANIFLLSVDLLVSSELVLVVLTIVPVLITVAFFTLFERKLLASVQRRRGPSVVGFWGLLRPFADGLKLVLKEFIIPWHAVLHVFFFSPIWVFSFSFSAWMLIPFSYENFYINLEFSVLFFLAFSSLGVYGVILGGWASNSRYALLGALRSAAQVVSYEISLGLTVLPIAIWSKSLNIFDIVFAQSYTYEVSFACPFLPLAVIFFISCLAETNRTPFDLPEAEAELVAGFNVEYGSAPFALFFLAEYCNILIASSFTCLLFFSGWGGSSSFASFFYYIYFSPAILAYLTFTIRIVLITSLFIFVRACLPRHRYDQLMHLCWQIFLPFSFGFFHLSTGLFVSTLVFSF